VPSRDAISARLGSLGKKRRETDLPFVLKCLGALAAVVIALAVAVRIALR
jgi:hypothetical protein